MASKMLRIPNTLALCGPPGHKVPCTGTLYLVPCTGEVGPYNNIMSLPVQGTRYKVQRHPVVTFWRLHFGAFPVTVSKDDQKPITPMASKIFRIRNTLALCGPPRWWMSLCASQIHSAAAGAHSMLRTSRIALHPMPLCSDNLV